MNKTNCISLIVASFFIAVNFTSCATIFRGANPHKEIPVSGFPSGAEVVYKNKVVGTTPTTLEINSRKASNVTIKKEGFNDEHIPIKVSLSYGWTALSIATSWPSFFVATIVDAKTGALNRIETDSISYNLTPVLDGLNKEGEQKNNSVSIENKSTDSILNPVMQIRTSNSIVYIQPKTAVTIRTKNGARFASFVKSIEANAIVLAKGNIKIRYTDIESIRVYPIRRWYPTLTAVAVIPPIFWHVSSKYFSISTTNCKKRIQTIKTVDFLPFQVFGKSQCY
jgi:hypothetical protein